VADLGTALYAGMAILAALHQGKRTGESVHIDIALTDCAMAMATARGGRNQIMRDADRLHLFPTNGIFRCGDGQAIALGVVEEHFWPPLRDELAVHEPALADPRFATDALRRQHGDELLDMVERALTQRSAADWVARLSARDVPVSPVISLEQAVTSPQTEARGIVQSLFPALWNGQPMAQLRRATPALGQHTREILGTLAADTGWQAPA
jgi:crotonobetainyl-CoA:carnitine CoA-transferase CaiB-like acyl-CoA transferase